MLKRTKIELELLTNIDLLHFFKKGIRGGVSTCIKRKSISNNIYLNGYDPLKPISYILYLDATNLYRYAMQQKSPHGEISWLNTDEIQNLKIEDISDSSDVGYALEVDLD